VLLVVRTPRNHHFLLVPKHLSHLSPWHTCGLRGNGIPRRTWATIDRSSDPMRGNGVPTITPRDAWPPGAQYGAAIDTHAFVIWYIWWMMHILPLPGERCSAYGAL
jgi:hypothetical protein